MKRNYGDGNMNIELMQSRSFLERKKKKEFRRLELAVVAEGEASEPQ